MKIRLLLAALPFFAISASVPAVAQGYGPGYNKPIRYHHHSFENWKAGRWFHGHHNSRLGYWWIVDNIWYYYPEPVYPYPDPYTPPTIGGYTYPNGPDVQYWYCPNPQGYYPNVPRCFAPWQRLGADGVPEQAQSFHYQQQYQQQEQYQPYYQQQYQPQYQQQQQYQPQYQQQQPQILTPPNAPVPLTPPQPLTPSQRNEDYRTLNDISADFSAIDLNRRNASSKLRKIEARIDDLRKSLLDRSYDTKTILRDTENLNDRVEKEISRGSRRKS